MTSSKIPSAAARIARAREEVELAESELDAALHDIEVLPREQKRAVSQVVTDAFEKLREVRSALAALQSQVEAVPTIAPTEESEKGGP
jgi:hypothetical protein